MTLRLPAEKAQALRERAKEEDRSQQDVLVAALDEYLDRHSRRALLDDVLATEVPRYADALRRLGE